MTAALDVHLKKTFQQVSGEFNRNLKYLKRFKLLWASRFSIV